MTDKPKANTPTAAPPKKVEKKAEVADGRIKVGDLAKEFGIDGRTVRLTIRSLDLRANQGGAKGRGIYAFPPGDSTLVKIRKALTDRRTKEQEASKAEAKS